MPRYISPIVIGLLIFLPVSAWLVSLFGDFRLSLGRDVLLLLLVPTALIIYQKRPKSRWFWLVVGFGFYLLLSYLWAEESLAQWLRGVRFYGAPIILAAIAYLLAKSVDLGKFLRPIAWITLGVVILGFVEYLFPEVFRYSLATNALRGQLDYFHLAGDFARMQGTLAGPNALGLFLMVGLLTFPLFKAEYRSFSPFVYLLFIAALVLTFSRSSLLGYLVAMMIAGFVLNPIWKRPKMTFLAVALAITLGFGAYSWLIDDPARQISNITRIQQYERVASEISEIGLFGKGPGSAGLVSQYRLDSGENYYTENIYLDIFEGLGVVGLVLFLTIWVATLWRLFRSKEPEGFWVGLSGVSLMVAGLFISNYTGQAAIFYFWLMAGLVIGNLDKNEHRD